MKQQLLSSVLEATKQDSQIYLRKRIKTLISPKSMLIALAMESNINFAKLQWSQFTFKRSVSVPMRKLSTREPYAGEPHVRFGGRGGLLLYPYQLFHNLGRSRNEGNVKSVVHIISNCLINLHFRQNHPASS